MNKIAKIFLITNGIILIVYGLVFLIKPTTLGQIIGFTSNSPNTLVEVMAFYGGLELCLGWLFILSSLDIKRYNVSLTAFSFIFYAAGIARLIGIVQYGHEDPSQLIVAGIELSFAIFAFSFNKSFL